MAPFLPTLQSMPNVENVDKDKVINLIKDAKHIAVVPSKISGANAFAAAVGLFHMLKELEDKSISFVFTGKVPDVCEGLIKKEEITSNIAQRDLLISVDYAETPASKVFYSTENDILNLKIGPVPKDFDKNTKVTTRLIGFNFDLVIMVGVQEMEDLGQTYRELEKEFENAKIMNLDNTNRNHRYGILNIIDNECDSLAALVFKKAYEWSLVPNEKAAKALLVGMTYKQLAVNSQAA